MPRLFFPLLSFFTPPPFPLLDGAVCKCWLSIIALCGPTVTKCVWLNWPQRRSGRRRRKRRRRQRRSRVGVKKPQRHPFAWCLVFLLSSVLCLLSSVLGLDSWVCLPRKVSIRVESQVFARSTFRLMIVLMMAMMMMSLTLGEPLEKLPSIVYRNLCKLPLKKIVQIRATISIYSRALSYCDLKWDQYENIVCMQSFQVKIFFCLSINKSKGWSKEGPRNSQKRQVFYYSAALGYSLSYLCIYRNRLFTLFWCCILLCLQFVASESIRVEGVACLLAAQEGQEEK